MLLVDLRVGKIAVFTLFHKLKITKKVDLCSEKAKERLGRPNFKLASMLQAL